MTLDQLPQLPLERLSAAVGVVAQVEPDLELPRRDILRPGAGANIGDLQPRGREEIVAVGEFQPAKLGQERSGPMRGVVCRVGIGRMALGTVDVQAALDGAAPADPDDIAQPLPARRLADQAGIGHQSARLQLRDHRPHAVTGRPFFVGGQQNGNHAGVIGVFRQERLQRDHEGRHGRFHVGRAATVEHAVSNLGRKRRRGPVHLRTRRHHIGMPDQHQMRRAAAVQCEEVANVFDIDRFDRHPARSSRSAINAWQPASSGVTVSREIRSRTSSSTASRSACEGTVAMGMKLNVLASRRGFDPSSRNGRPA